MAGLWVEKPATIDPVDLTWAKNFLRVDEITEDDDLITGLIGAATELAELYCRRCFIQKGFLLCLDSFPYFTDTMLSQMAYPPSYYSLPRYSTTLWNYSQMIKTMRPPLISVDRITYMDSTKASFKDLVPQPLPWYPQTEYANGAQVADYNGNVQTLVSPDPSSEPTLESGIVPPEFSTIVTGITAEAAPATAIWRNDGPLPQGEFGSFIIDKISEPGRIFPGIQTPSTGAPVAGYWPSVLYVPNAVQIHYTAGYGTTLQAVPHGVKAAILMIVSNLYENRVPTKDDEEQIPKTARSLLWPYRVIDFAQTRG
jgi:hypothetical protein